VLSVPKDILVQSYYTLIASETDLASRTMLNYLINNKGFEVTEKSSGIFESKIHKNVKLYVSELELLSLEDIDADIHGSKAIIFLSKHESTKKIPTLTCHSTGNFLDNAYGGNPKELGLCYPSLQKNFMNRINNKKSLVPGYELSIEATHHGPTSLLCPVLFVEIGSSYNQWTDIKAASLVCDTVLEVITLGFRNCVKIGIGLGGSHYPAKFNKLLLESEYGLATIAAKHSLHLIDHSMLKQMSAKSIEKVTHIVVDKKGLGKERRRIMNLISHFGLEILSV
jgi:D-aminoacyl-tRNA deacylase